MFHSRENLPEVGGETAGMPAPVFNVPHNVLYIRLA